MGIRPGCLSATSSSPADSTPRLQCGISASSATPSSTPGRFSDEERQMRNWLRSVLRSTWRFCERYLMPWNTTTVRSSGFVVTAAVWNDELVENMKHLEEVAFATFN